MAKIPRLKEIKTVGYSWTHVTHPTEMEIKQLQRKFGFHELDLKDVLPPIQRPKLVARDSHLFMILLYPLYNRATRKIHPVEVDLFIGKDFLVTSISEGFYPLTDLFNRAEKNTSQTLGGLTAPVNLLCEILKRLEHYCLPMSIHISNDIDQVENNVFKKMDKAETIDEILRIKINIVNFKKSMNRHARVLQHLGAKMNKLFPDLPADLLNSLVEDTEDMWEMLENHQETINAIHESQISLLNFRSNSIMLVFTIFMTIIFALGLTISLILLGIDPDLIVHKDFIGLGIIFTGLTAVVLVMVAFFKKKKWL